MRKLYKYLLGIVTSSMLFSASANASEITKVNAILYTNDETVVYEDSNLNGVVVLPTVQANLPILVTGITDNGFFQIDLCGTYYIPGYGLSPLPADSNKNPSDETLTVLAESESKPANNESIYVSSDILSSVQTYENYIYRVIQLVNDARQKESLAPLIYNKNLTYAATHRSLENAQHNNFSHIRPDGTKCFTVLSLYGIDKYNCVGENIALGQKTPERVVTAWMNSPKHRANILGDFTHIGVGISCNSEGRLYWTQLFHK